jgi:hypothetical protein
MARGGLRGGMWVRFLPAVAGVGNRPSQGGSVLDLGRGGESEGEFLGHHSPKIIHELVLLALHLGCSCASEEGEGCHKRRGVMWWRLGCGGASLQPRKWD